MHIFLTLPDEEHEDVPLFSIGPRGPVLVDQHSLQKPRAALEKYNNGIFFLNKVGSTHPFHYETT